MLLRMRLLASAPWGYSGNTLCRDCYISTALSWVTQMSLWSSNKRCSLSSCMAIGSFALKSAWATAALPLQFCCDLWALALHSICISTLI